MAMTRSPFANLLARAALMVLLTLISLGSAGAQAPAASPSPSPTRDPSAFYLPLVKDPGALGFSPDASLFRVAYKKITTIHADNPSDAQLYQGVADEVAALLAAEKVSSAGLEALPRDATLPEAIVERWGTKIDRPLLWYAMTRGLFAGTHDKFSLLMTPREYRRLLEGLQNRGFVGVGITIELDKDNHDQLTVIEPVEGAPAALAGIEPRDPIVRIDGKSTRNMTLDEASSMIRGLPGTRVTLTVKRNGKDIDIVIPRATIKVPSAASKMLDGGIGYLKLKVFGMNTDVEFREALQKVLDAHPRGLILDLRNNGGGYNTAAVAVCAHFLQPDELVTYMIEKSGKRREYRGGQANPIRLPLVILVNKNSASASEITTACLRDLAHATIIGTRTYGKGSSQQLSELDGGAGMRVTFAHFYSPKGSHIDKVGIEPDLKVEMDPRYIGRGDKDTQLERAIDYLKTH
jgi:carboxyl-terminal processing protease